MTKSVNNFSRTDNEPCDNENGVPVIDLSTDDETLIAKKIDEACSTFGFFQVVSHGISQQLIDDFREQMCLYFDLDRSLKQNWKRSEGNSRGYFDDELTKRRRDWKEALDVGIPGSRNWSLPDDDIKNACLDGFNRFPNQEILRNFRTTVISYFEACASLSNRLACLMVSSDIDNETTILDNKGIDNNTVSMIESLKKDHTSYLRMNHYPPCAQTEAEVDGTPPPLGISPHYDAGFLTVLLQDEDCFSLQVARPMDADVEESEYDWVTVQPVKGSLTINTGDMAMLWSNGRYRAPLHRVKTNPKKKRYSAPFFYNPGYNTLMKPLAHIHKSISDGNSLVEVYRPVLWGYFRALRFAGDFTDLGVEIQISDYETEKQKSAHIKIQEEFQNLCNFYEPFNIEKYRALLEGIS